MLFFFWRFLEILVFYVIVVIVVGKWRNKSRVKLLFFYFLSVVVKVEFWMNVYLICFCDYGLCVFFNFNINIVFLWSMLFKVFIWEGFVFGMGVKLRNDNILGNLNWLIKFFYVLFLRVSEVVNYLCKCIIELLCDYMSICI